MCEVLQTATVQSRSFPSTHINIEQWSRSAFDIDRSIDRIEGCSRPVNEKIGPKADLIITCVYS